VLAHSFGLIAAKLAGQVWRQQGNGLGVTELTLAFSGDVFLLEPEAGTVKKRLNGAL
jgi:hypothetical protein